jgi:hypothetical protein
MLSEDLRRWFKEKWTAQDGSECGDYKGRGRVKCRPSRRVSEKSPETWSEMSKEEKEKAVRKKQEAHREGKQFSSHKTGKTWDGPKNKYRPKKKNIKEDAQLPGESYNEYKTRLLRQIKAGEISSFDNHDRIHGALAYLDSIQPEYNRGLDLVVRIMGRDAGGRHAHGLKVTGLHPSGKFLTGYPTGAGGKNSRHRVEVGGKDNPLAKSSLHLSHYSFLEPDHRRTLQRIMNLREGYMRDIIEKYIKRKKDCGCNSLYEEKEKKPYKGFKKGKNHPEGGLSRAEAKRQGIHAGVETKDEAKKKGGFGKLSKKTQARRKSFCARMCGMKKRRTSSKTANDPKSKINAALRVWGCRCGTNESYEPNINMIMESKNNPTNKKLWSQAKALAKKKFDVYPSAYANAWAAKWYKKRGGGWETNESFVSELQETSEMTSAQSTIKDRLKQKVRGREVGGGAKNANKFYHTSANESYIPEEVVNQKHKGTMTDSEKAARDRLAKRLKGVRAIKGKDSVKNARYRYATYLILNRRKKEKD